MESAVLIALRGRSSKRHVQFSQPVSNGLLLMDDIGREAGERVSQSVALMAPLSPKRADKVSLSR